MMTQAEKAERFAALHRRPGILVLPNAYDAASACILADAGFKAIATTSGGCAFSLGICDGENITRDAMAAIVARICTAVDLPVSADMEAGYGPTPGAVADTVRATIIAGAAGINIEDSTKTGPRELLEFDSAIARIRAARTAATDAGLALVINGRTDVYPVGGGDESALFDEATRRANAYLEAGADCAFVMGVRDGELIGRLAAAIHGPLNVLAGADSPSVAELEALGVKRVTVGSGFAKAALTVVKKGAEELREKGTFEFTRGALGQADIHRILKGG
ncbi:MAG: isocitrate lyase/phosphoenolpyruvate mutase family protein [Alphaproteobacteria bacterium]|nr:isocitrate lyase/phosphoenolpyruvate mutase family protein [Alphaproteobacteria bacterium]MCZ6741359.1 isocitrate lyase/phosphoenolpyruvate mutase family protein [Alphaproteobacteria bacterium]